MGRIRILRWFGIVCFSLVACVLLESTPSTLAASGTSMELGPDGCTLYAAVGSRIGRFDICSNRPLPDFGQPGVLRDTAQITIRNAIGDVVVQVSGMLVAGTHIARE